MPEQDADPRGTPADSRNAAARNAATRGHVVTAPTNPAALTTPAAPTNPPDPMARADGGHDGAPFAGPEYRRLFDAARRSLEQTGGDLSRMVTVKTPDDLERRAIIGITGQYRPEGIGVLAVSLADVDLAIREHADAGSLSASVRRSRTARRNGSGWRTDAK